MSKLNIKLYLFGFLSVTPTLKCEGQELIDSVMKSLYAMQYSLVFEDAVSHFNQFYSTEGMEPIGIDSCVECNESFVSWMKLSSGDSLLLFYPEDWPDQNAKRKPLKNYNNFLSSIINRKEIPFEKINNFLIMFEVICNEDIVLNAHYVLKFYSGELLIDNRRICFIKSPISLLLTST